MKPQDPPTLSPDQFDFMLKDNQKPKSRFKLPLPDLPKPILLIGAVILALVVILILASVLSKSRNRGVDQIVDIMAQSQEIARVTNLTEPQMQTPETKALAATTEAALTSEQQQLSEQLQNRKVKFDTKKLDFYIDQDIVAQLQAAAQNGTLDAAYTDYLKKQLTTYRAALEKVYPAASPQTKVILQEAFNSTQILLSAPQLSS